MKIEPFDFAQGSIPSAIEGSKYVILLMKILYMFLIRLIKKWHLEIIFIAPLVLFLLIFTMAPIIHTICLSFQDARLHQDFGGLSTEAFPPGAPVCPVPFWCRACRPGRVPPKAEAKVDVKASFTPLEKESLTGFTLANYKELISQKGFREALFNTIFIALFSLMLEVGFGLILALVLSHSAKYLKILRSIFILPLAIPTVVVGVMMSYLFSTSGWINRILLDLSLIDSPIYWIGGGIKSLAMIILADCWKVTPIVMLILLAGLESIDRDLYKAARIDGASSFYIFKRITLPLLLPSITVAVIIRGIDAFRIFALPLILMGQNLKVIGTYAYLEYVEYNNARLSAASSVMLLFMILVAVIFYIKVAGKRGLVAA